MRCGGRWAGCTDREAIARWGNICCEVHTLSKKIFRMQQRKYFIYICMNVLMQPNCDVMQNAALVPEFSCFCSTSAQLRSVSPAPTGVTPQGITSGPTGVPPLSSCLDQSEQAETTLDQSGSDQDLHLQPLGHKNTL